MAAETSQSIESLPPGSQRVLKFSAEKAGADGLRYEDYMHGLSGSLQGMDVNGLSTALHQLEVAGLLQPDPLGTPGRRIRLTPKGRSVALGSSAAPTPQEAAEEAEDPHAPKLKPAAPGPGPAPATAMASSSSSPSPSPSESVGKNMDDREKLIEQRDEESRKRLKLVIEREDAVRTAEEKLRTEEKRLLGEEERLSEKGKVLDKDRAEHTAKVEETRKAFDNEKGQIETERKQLQSAGQALQRHRFELEQKEAQIKSANTALDERTRGAEIKSQELNEREKVVTEQEDALHEHLTAVKNHLQSVRATEDGIGKVHEAVSASRARRGKPSKPSS